MSTIVGVGGALEWPFTHQRGQPTLVLRLIGLNVIFLKQIWFSRRLLSVCRLSRSAAAAHRFHLSHHDEEQRLRQTHR